MTTLPTEPSVRPGHVDRRLSPAEQSIARRELAALAALMAVRAVVFVIFVPSVWLLGAALWDKLLTTALLGGYVIWLLCAWRCLREQRRPSAIGLAGVALDVVLLSALPLIWYTALSADGPVPVATMLKSSVTQIALLLVALNALALRPLYPALMTIGALCVHGVLLALTVHDPASQVTTSYLLGYTSAAVPVGRVFTGLLVVALVGTVLTLLTVQARRMVMEAVGLERANVQLGRYFSPNLVPRLLANPALFEVGGERRELSFVFTDLQGFTALVEALDPAVAVPLINRYLNALVEVAFRHQGTVDKIVGDAVHVIFGAPGEQPDHAARAVDCALEMDAVAEALRAELAPEIALGVTRIGVNSGVAVVGNFGGDALFDYTAHGAAINTAARLEAANKVFGTRICVSADTVARVPDFSGRPLGALSLSGRSAPLDAFEALAPGAAASTGAYGVAYEALRAGSADAVRRFEALRALDPGDPVVRFHLARLRRGEAGIDVNIT